MKFLRYLRVFSTIIILVASGNSGIAQSCDEEFLDTLEYNVIVEQKSYLIPQLSGHDIEQYCHSTDASIYIASTSFQDIGYVTKIDTAGNLLWHVAINWDKVDDLAFDAVRNEVVIANSKLQEIKRYSIHGELLKRYNVLEDMEWDMLITSNNGIDYIADWSRFVLATDHNPFDPCHYTKIVIYSVSEHGEVEVLLRRVNEGYYLPSSSIDRISVRSESDWFDFRIRYDLWLDDDHSTTIIRMNWEGTILREKGSFQTDIEMAHQYYTYTGEYLNGFSNLWADCRKFTSDCHYIEIRRNKSRVDQLLDLYEDVNIMGSYIFDCNAGDLPIARYNAPWSYSYSRSIWNEGFVYVVRGNDLHTLRIKLPDEDNDGYNSGIDCNDHDPNINPSVDEIVNNDVDENCDGIVGIDLDMDGYLDFEDCNDTNPNINPSAEEIINNDVDENCDDTIAIDMDEDGHLDFEDCDDNNPDINPSAEEIPNNGIDDNCNGEVDEVISSTLDVSSNLIHIHPNPANHIIHVATDMTGPFRSQIFDMKGQLLLEYREQKDLDISNISDGTYILMIHSDTGQLLLVERVVIAN